MTKMRIQDLYEKVYARERIDLREAKILYEQSDLLLLGQLAHRIRMKVCDPKIVSYIVDRNMNYTNVCVVDCSFCAFYRKPNQEGAYVLPEKTIQKKLLETKSLGGTGILLQGGLNPRLRLDYYQDLLKLIKGTCEIHIHGFSPAEIVYLARLEKKSLRDILIALKSAGLDSIPGGGAEILVDRVRREISRKKCSSDQWLEVMRQAHLLGLKTTATMMFGHIETLEERIAHLEKIRQLQDETGGFTAFIAWTYQQGPSTPLRCKKTYGHEYLKTLALSRIYLDNFPNIQGSWVTQGEAIGQLSMFFGANDLGSIMIEENVVSSAGTSFAMNEAKMQKIIREAGWYPFKRNTLYTNLPNFKTPHLPVLS